MISAMPNIAHTANKSACLAFCVDGIPREEILDVRVCDQWKKNHYFEYHKGHNCGICSAVCPYGTIALKKGHSKENTS